MLSFLYNFAWTLVVILFLPAFFFSKKLRIAERLGLGLGATPSGGRRIWVHALSVGEVISAIPLIRILKLEYPAMPIVLTVKTAQGIAVARKELNGEVERLIPMPVDFWWSISLLFHYINPSVLMLIEGDIWPGLVSFLHKRGINVLLINGRISPRTFRSYNRFRFFVRSMFNQIELCLMQSEIDRERMIEIGVPPEKVRNTGNIKFDRPWRDMEPEERTRLMNLLNLRSEAKIWVAGSTHEGEDRIILETYKRLKGDFPELILIIAPRKIESAEALYEYCSARGIDAVKKSHLRSDVELSYGVLILDTIGELERIYGLASISFVGGSMVPVGGHNLLEPASFGCPVLFGQYTHNFLLMSELLLGSGGGWRVKDGDELFIKIRTLLSDAGLSKKMGSNAKEFVLKNSGAIDRVIEHVRGYINNA
jgi:3-deoxy-D-manno-octulosonic-acid transferase